VRSLAPLVFVLATIALAACGGTTYVYQTPQPVSPTIQPTALTTSTVTFNVIVPNIGGNARVRPHAIVPGGSLSVAIQLDSVNGTASSTTPTVANLDPSTSGCEQSSTQLSCVINVTAPVGALIYTLTVYSAPSAGGSSLGAGNLAVTTTPGATVVAPATLSGTVAKIAVTVGGAALGVHATVPVTVQAEDAKNNTVLGNYTSPIALTDTDASGQTTLSSSATNITSGTTVVTLTYAGGAMSAPATVNASASGVSPSDVTPGTFSPSLTYPTVNGASTTFYYSQTVSTGTNGPPNSAPSTSKGSYTIDMATGQTYNGINNLVQISGLVVPDPGLPTMFTSINYSSMIAYYAWTQQAAGSSLGLVGFTTSDGLVLACAAPYNQMIIAPLSGNWNVRNGSAACTATNLDVLGDTSAQVRNADGSYTENYNLTPSGGPVIQLNLNSDGSALQSVNNLCGCPTSSIIAIAVPNAGAATIPVDITDFGSNGIPPPGVTVTPSPIPTSVPNPWIAAGIPNGAMPSPPESDTFTTVGTIGSLPPDCAIPASVLGPNPTFSEADETILIADPNEDYNIGYYSSQAIKHYYLDGVGEVCNENVGYQVAYDSDPTDYYFNVPTNPNYDPNYDTTQQTIWQYVTATTLTATSARRRAATQAFAAATYAFARASMSTRRTPWSWLAWPRRR
jgi:hypothetical protein